LKPAKVANTKSRNAESLLSTEINLNHSSEEVEEYLFASSTKDSASNKLKFTHQTSELVVSLIINHEKHQLRALADSGASSSIILEQSISESIIRNDNRSKTTWSTMGGQFKTDMTGLDLERSDSDV
jgi:hypothetical protein